MVKVEEMVVERLVVMHTEWHTEALRTVPLE